MRKTLILAAASLAIALSGQAHAGWSNGISLNGLDTNNGISLNGLETSNGVQQTGAASAPRADVTLQGVTLSDGEVIHGIIVDQDH